MRTETPWLRQRRADRRRWWQEVLEGADRPTAASWNEVLDETVRLRFHVGQAATGHAEADASVTR